MGNRNRKEVGLLGTSGQQGRLLSDAVEPYLPFFRWGKDCGMLQEIKHFLLEVA